MRLKHSFPPKLVFTPRVDRSERTANITGNLDVAPLYSFSVAAGGAAELVAKHRKALDESNRIGRQRWEAVRDRSNKKNPGRVDKVSVEAFTRDEAISRLRLLVSEYFKQEVKAPWRMGGVVIDI